MTKKEQDSLKEKEEIEHLKEQLAQCEKERDEYLGGWKRERADFLNYKKEEAERIQEWVAYAKEKMLLELLLIADSLEKAEQEISADAEHDSVVKGLVQTIGQIKSFLKKQEVEEIDAEGKKFDPNVHEAVAQEEKEGMEAGNIIAVMQKGYMHKGKVLRAAKVKVAR